MHTHLERRRSHPFLSAGSQLVQKIKINCTPVRQKRWKSHDHFMAELLQNAPIRQLKVVRTWGIVLLIAITAPAAAVCTTTRTATATNTTTALGRFVQTIIFLTLATVPPPLNNIETPPRVFSGKHTTGKVVLR